MKISVNFRDFTENWPVKAACFLIAVCLYIFYVLTIQDSRSFTVPLKIESSNGIVVAGNYPNRVKISLKGKTEEIASIRENDVTAYLDLNYLSKDGTYKLPVLVKLPQQAMLLDTLEVKLSPEWVSLKVEEQISGFVNVNPLINGKPAYGYEIKNITVKPDTVEITGPRSIVEHCTRVQTQAVSVKNAEVSLNKAVYPENLGSFLKLKNKETVNVTVEIVPVVSEKKFDNIDVAFTGLNYNFATNPSKNKVSFSLKGNLLDIEKFKPAHGTAFVNCAEIIEPGVYELPVYISVSDKFEVTAKSHDSITVEISEIQKEQEVTEPVENETAESKDLSSDSNGTGE